MKSITLRLDSGAHLMNLGRAPTMDTIFTLLSTSLPNFDVSDNHFIPYTDLSTVLYAIPSPRHSHSRITLHLDDLGAGAKDNRSFQILILLNLFYRDSKYSTSYLTVMRFDA
jgi:hypothetical protein